MKVSPFWIKAVAAAAATSVLAAGAAVVALKVIFPEPVLRERILSAARKQLGREVRLERIGLGLTGLSLRGLEISESPDFKAGTFLRVEAFHIRPSWRALLSRKLVVASVSAEGLKVTVVRGVDGRFNYATLTSSAPAAARAGASAQAAEAHAPELNVHRARVRRGLIEYRDEKEKSSWTVSDLAVSLDDFSMAEPFTLDTSFHVRGKAGVRPVNASVIFAGTIDPAKGERKAFKAKIKRLVLEQDGMKLASSGRVADLVLPDLAFEMTLSASGKTLLSAEGKAKVGEGTAEADFKAKTPGLDTRLIAKLLPDAGIPALDLPAIEAHAAGRYSPGQVDVRALSVAWSGGKVTGSGSAKGLGTPKPVFEGKATLGVDVPEITPGQYPFLKLPPKAWVPAARIDGEISLSGDELKVVSFKTKLKQGTVSIAGFIKRLGSAKPVPDLSVALALDVPSFKASDLPVEVAGLPASFALPSARLDGTVRVSGDDVRFDKVVVKAKDGSVKIDGTVAKALAGTPQPDVSIEADVNLPALTDKDLPFPGVPAGLSTPPSHWEAAVDYSAKVVRVRKLRLETGKNIISVEGSVSDPAGRAAFDLLVKCKSFVLDELTKLTPQTRDMKIAGSGYFAFSVTGHKLKPIYAGKLLFKDLGATVAGLPLSEFAGTVSFDEKRVDLPNLKGKVADGTLQLDLTIKDYSRTPDIQLEASLDYFDLAKYLTAKNKVAADSQAAKLAKPAQSGAAEGKTKIVSTRGRFEVGALSHT
ncbi:MAG: AsmA family protein, partial [Elusimicrobiota bacterium]